MQHPGVIKFKGQNVNGTVIHEIFREAEEIIGANLNENRLNIQKMHKFTIEHFIVFTLLCTPSRHVFMTQHKTGNRRVERNSHSYCNG